MSNQTLRLKYQLPNGISFEASGLPEVVERERVAFTDAYLFTFGPPAQGPSEPRPVSAIAPAPDLSVSIIRRVSGSIDPIALKKVIGMGQGASLIRPFDELLVPLDTGEQVPVVCGYVGSSFVRFVFKDAYCRAPMNNSGSNKGGYAASDGRRVVMEEIYSHFLPEWKEIIRPREIVEAVDGEEKRYFDPLWLPSATDVFGPRTPDRRWWPEEPDSFQLPIFQYKRDRVKEGSLEGDGTCCWWTRSPSTITTNFFCFVGSSGDAGHHGTNSLYELSPGFDI